MLLGAHDTQVVDTFTFHRKVARLCDATVQSDSCRWSTSFQTPEATVTNQLVDDFDGELPEVSLASVGPEFLLDNKRIEERSRDTHAIDPHIPLVCAARLVKSTHLIIEVDCSHVSVILNHSGCIRHVDAIQTLLWRLMTRLSTLAITWFERKYLSLLSHQRVARMLVF